MALRSKHQENKRNKNNIYIYWISFVIFRIYIVYDTACDSLMDRKQKNCRQSRGLIDKNISYRRSSFLAAFRWGWRKFPHSRSLLFFECKINQSIFCTVNHLSIETFSTHIFTTVPVNSLARTRAAKTSSPFLWTSQLLPARCIVRLFPKSLVLCCQTSRSHFGVTFKSQQDGPLFHNQSIPSVIIPCNQALSGKAISNQITYIVPLEQSPFDCFRTARFDHKQSN